MVRAALGGRGAALGEAGNGTLAGSRDGPLGGCRRRLRRGRRCGGGRCSDLRLAVRANLPARIERLAAHRAGLLQLAHAVRAAQEVLLDLVVAMRAERGSRARRAAPRRPASRARARVRPRGTRAAARSCRRSCRRTGTATRPPRSRRASDRRSAGGRPRMSSTRAPARQRRGTGPAGRSARFTPLLLMPKMAGRSISEASVMGSGVSRATRHRSLFVRHRRARTCVHRNSRPNR